MADLADPRTDVRDRIAGGAEGRRPSIPTVTFEELFCGRHDRAEPPLILDVRRTEEYARGHLHGAINLRLRDLHDRLEELPHRQLWVYCRDGRRALLAAVVLERAGHDVVVLADDYENAFALGLLDAPG